MEKILHDKIVTLIVVLSPWFKECGPHFPKGPIIWAVGSLEKRALRPDLMTMPAALINLLPNLRPNGSAFTARQHWDTLYTYTFIVSNIFFVADVGNG